MLIYDDTVMIFVIFMCLLCASRASCVQLVIVAIYFQHLEPFNINGGGPEIGKKVVEIRIELQDMKIKIFLFDSKIYFDADIRYKKWWRFCANIYCFGQIWVFPRFLLPQQKWVWFRLFLSRVVNFKYHFSACFVESFRFFW